ncbi:TonB-dependent receptor [Simiduia curdlanivorans]|uniref:TonB-dependent receptor domain-containing protein n=1 Tax=Simiduia curdlanivorans TaxID=1492769 RepID=A0ABV8V422_9GAMM|nr:TonB-dependent receptor [Simiduia curdlanivorans]MDN3637344.1 TonB-dependent receptor [Simiduia curdlanivorans]
MKLTSLSAAIALTIVGVQAQAQDLQQEEMVVTATRTETPLAQTFAPVSVLTAAEIEQLQVRDVPELISRFTGVDMVQRGGRGANSSAFVRGTNSGHLLVLVDGVRVGSATLGSTALEFVDPAAIERIELVRGPRSSLYGSDAIGGIVQIFTRQAENDGASLAVNVGYGKHNEQQARLVAGWKDEATQLNLVASHISTDGFDRTVNTSNGNGDKDAYAADRLALNASQQLSQAWSLEASGQYQQGESDSDNGFCFVDCEPFATFTNYSADVGLKGQINQVWLTQLRAGLSQDESQQDDHIAGVAEINYGGNNRFNTERESASWQNDLALAEASLLSLGVDYYVEQVESNNVVYAVDSRDNTGVFVQYQGRSGGHNLIAALRYDDNEQFGSKDTGSITYGFDLADGWSLMASYGSAFKAPSFNDLYYPFSGNAELKPESSRNLEAGIKFHQDGLLFAMNIFENDVSDLIAWAPDAGGNWYPFNVNDAEITGVEAEFAQNFDGWLLGVNYTALDAEDKATGKRLINRSDQLFNADLSRAFGGITLGLGFEARSARYADQANTQKLSGYGLVNLRAAWAISNNLVLEAKVNNLLDKDYTVVSGYYEDGINAFGSATYRF